MKCIKGFIKTFKDGYGKIDKKTTNSYAFPFIVSFLIWILSSWIAVNIKELVEGQAVKMEEQLAIYCSALFSTAFTFFITTTIQNYFEIKYSKDNTGKRKMIWNGITFLFSFVYFCFYVKYLIELTACWSIIFLFISALGIFFSFKAFVETYNTEENSISG